MGGLRLVDGDGCVPLLRHDRGLGVGRDRAGVDRAPVPRHRPPARGPPLERGPAPRLRRGLVVNRPGALPAAPPTAWLKPCWAARSEEHTSELQTLKRNSYAA